MWWRAPHAGSLLAALARSCLFQFPNILILLKALSVFKPPKTFSLLRNILLKLLLCGIQTDFSPNSFGIQNILLSFYIPHTAWQTWRLLFSCAFSITVVYTHWAPLVVRQLLNMCFWFGSDQPLLLLALPHYNMLEEGLYFSLVFQVNSIAVQPYTGSLTPFGFSAVSFKPSLLSDCTFWSCSGTISWDKLSSEHPLSFCLFDHVAVFLRMDLRLAFLYFTFFGWVAFSYPIFPFCIVLFLPWVVSDFPAGSSLLTACSFWMGFVAAYGCSASGCHALFLPHLLSLVLSVP